MKIISVEGNSGSGKSTFSKFLAKALDFEYVDLDVVAKDCYMDSFVIEQLMDFFPKDIFEGSKVDYKKLGEIVFNDISKLQKLEEILYPCLIKKVDKIIESAINGCVLDGIKIHKTKFFNASNLKVFVKRNNEARMDSLVKRDNITRGNAKNRDNVISYEGLDFDLIIENDGDLIDLKNNVGLVISKLFKGEKCLYAGSFDPLTNGHLQLIKEASEDYDYVFVGIGDNPSKKRNYDKDEMTDLVNEVIKSNSIKNAFCLGYKGFTGDMAIKLGVNTLIRGIRNKKDEEEEKLIEEYNYEHFNLKTKYYVIEGMKEVSSTLVRERVKQNLSISNLVPKIIENYIKNNL